MKYIVVHDAIRSPTFPWLVYCLKQGAPRRQVAQHSTEEHARNFAKRCEENIRGPQ
jgi:hypothetical protein